MSSAGDRERPPPDHLAWKLALVSPMFVFAGILAVFGIVPGHVLEGFIMLVLGIGGIWLVWDDFRPRR